MEKKKVNSKAKKEKEKELEEELIEDEELETDEYEEEDDDYGGIDNGFQEVYGEIPVENRLFNRIEEGFSR